MWLRKLVINLELYYEECNRTTGMDLIANYMIRLMRYSTRLLFGTVTLSWYDSCCIAVAINCQLHCIDCITIVFPTKKVSSLSSFLQQIRLSLHLPKWPFFPDGSGVLTGTRMSPFWILLELRMTEVVVTTGELRCAKFPSNCYHQQTNTELFTGRMPFLSGTGGLLKLIIF